MKPALFLAAAIALTAASPLIAFASSVEVTPANMNGWYFDSFDNNYNPVTAGPFAGTAEMVTGPAGQPLGTGSAELATNGTNGNGGESIATNNFDGTRLDALTSLSYWTYMMSNNGQQFPYIALAISTDGKTIAADGSNLNFIDFEPPYQTPTTGNSSLPDQGATALGTWQNWNALVGGWDAPNAGTGVTSISDYLTAHPDATIADPSGVYPGFAGINLQVGFGSSGDTFDGNVDAFTIGTAAGVTTYDFEPAAVAVPLPSAAGMGLSLLALVGGAALLRKKLRVA